MDCFDENIIVEFLDGSLSPGQVVALQRHLDQCGACRQLLAEVVRTRIAAEKKGRTGGQSVVDPLDIEGAIKKIHPEQPGRYSILGEKGRGGQARVLLAYDESIGRELAFKELLPDPAADSVDSAATPVTHTIQQAARFLREARITGQLAHPSIIPVYEIGRRSDGTLYYTMQLVRGKTLAIAFAECSNLGERMGLLGHFLNLGHAIAYAHSRGVIHRDLKPQNIMVGEFGETVLLDWGLAKVKDQGGGLPEKDLEALVGVPGEENVLQTEQGTAMGTPAYMSPEQAHGKIEAIDERSDIWGLGAVLYELLTGSPPFKGKNLKQVLVECERGSVEPVSKVCPDAPRELAAVADKALAYDPGRRYQKAAELSADVAAYMTGSRVSAYEYSSWELVKRFAAKNKMLMIACGIVMAVIVAGLVLVSMAYRRETSALKRERFQLAQAYAEKSRSLMNEGEFLFARIYAAAALNHNPFKGPIDVSGREKRGDLPQEELFLRSSSHLVQSSTSPVERLEKIFVGDGPLNRIAFSHDGRMLAAASANHTVWIWDIPSGRVVHVLRGHEDFVLGVAFGPKDQWIASCGFDRTVRLWDVVSGRQLQVLKGHDREIEYLAVSPDGKRLATASDDQTVGIWDAQKGKLLRRLSGHVDKVLTLAYSASGTALASAGEEHSILIWNEADGRLLKRLEGHTGRVVWVSFSNQDRNLVSAGADQTVRIWDLEAGAQLRSFNFQNYLWDASLSPDGSWLAFSFSEGLIQLVDVETGTLVQALLNHRNAVFDVKFSGDGQWLASSSRDRTVHLWRMAPRHPVRMMPGHGAAIEELAFSSDGKWLASAGNDQKVGLWDMQTGSRVRWLEGHGQAVLTVVFSPDGKKLISGGEDNTVRVWEVSSGKPLAVLKDHSDFVIGSAYSRNGQFFASSSLDARAIVWDAQGLSPMAVFTHPAQVAKVSFSPDDRLMAVSTVSNQGEVYVWELESQKLVGKYRDHVGVVGAVHFLPDGHSLISVGEDRLVHIWDLRTFTTNQKLAGHTLWVDEMNITEDGTLAVTGSGDKTVRIWSLRSGTNLATFYYPEEVMAAAFSPDGSHLAVGDKGIIRIVPIDFSGLQSDPRALLKAAEQAAGARLKGFKLELVGD